MRCDDRPAGDGLSSTTAILREATRSRHAALHDAPTARRLFAADYSLAEYRAHLALMLGIVEPLERTAERSLEPGVAAHFVPRSQRLREDLGALGASAAEISLVRRSRSIPHLTPAGVRGYLYVVLGSMLGGRIIARRLQSVLGASASVRFYADEAGEADVRWTLFCAELDAGRSDDVAEIRAAAIATFDAFALWLAPLSLAGEGVAR